MITSPADAFTGKFKPDRENDPFCTGDPDELLTTEEVLARYRKTSRRTLSRWVESRGFPAPFIGGQGAPSLWRRGDLDDFNREVHRQRTFAKETTEGE